MIRTRLLLRYLLTTQELNPKQCYYKSLGIEPNSDMDTIRRAYLDLVKKYHPDLNKERDTTQIFTKIKKAYEVLSEEGDKQEYDKNKSYTHVSKATSVNQAEQKMKDIRQKFTAGEQNKRKDELNDELNFSHKLYKTHFQKIQKKKPTYNKFNDMDGHYYQPKDYSGPSPLKSYMFAFLPIGGLLGYFVYNNL